MWGGVINGAEDFGGVRNCMNSGAESSFGGEGFRILKKKRGIGVVASWVTGEIKIGRESRDRSG